MSSPSTISVACACGRSFQAPVGAAGKRARCPSCDKAVRVPIPSLETAEIDQSGSEVVPIPLGEPFPIEARIATASPGPAISPGTAGKATTLAGLREYKVLSRLDEWFASGGFRPDELEMALNTYAAQGWRLHSILAVPAGEPKAEEVIAILERPV